MAEVKCVICGKTVQGQAHMGWLKGMKVAFCEEHYDYCESCETHTCESVEGVTDAGRAE